MQSPLSRRAFSLMEMAIVLAVSGLMFSFVLSTVQGSGKLAVNCVMETKTQMQDIRGAVEKFARKYDRLPLPAARNIASDHVQYGREASGADIDAAAGVSFGALPWQALGLTSEYAGDCWGHKYTYAVTTALTTDNSSGGFKDSTVLGNITLKKDGTNDVNTQMAYAIISHGEDALGAVKLNWTEANPTHGWCTGSTNIGYTNCLATAATLIDATYNNGKDAGANYFDDIIVAAGKPKVVSTQGYYVYGWGTNSQTSNASSDMSLYESVYGFKYSGLMDRYGFVDTPQKVNTGGLVFTSFAIGFHHICALTAAGAAYCWGSNIYGQLGDNTTISSTLPVPVSGGLVFSSIYAGGDSTCGIAAGSAYCWGSNSLGKLGNGTTNISLTPSLVAGGLSFASLSVGVYHVCGRLSGGASTNVYCWGNNIYGQLGVTGGMMFYTPQLVNFGGYTYSSVAAGQDYTCAIRSTGAAYCWGNNWNSQLGDNTTTNNTNPQPVFSGYQYTSITAGWKHTCAIRTTGATYCWGYSPYGALGNGSVAAKKVPTLITAASGAAPVLTSLSASIDHPNFGYTSTCGLTAYGVPYCWGSNYGAELGIHALTNGYYWSSSIVSGGLIFSSIKTGGNRTCGLTSTNVLYCWGDNSYGALGNGDAHRNLSSPAPRNTDGITFTTAAASNHAACGITTAGAAYCWGDNSYGQLGKGDTIPSYAPVAVNGGLTFSSISANGNSACGLVSGAAYCWGDNASGQLGKGDTTPSYVPIAVSGGLTFSSISVGTNSACGLVSGAAYCWGINTYGQLGDNTTTTSATPVTVLGGITFNSITVSGDSTCGVSATGAGYCWGSINAQKTPTIISVGQQSIASIILSTNDVALALATPTSTCTNLWGSGTVPNGLTHYTYQSTTPTGACVAEYRTCTSGAWTGSYTQQTCTAGCNSRTISWTVGAKTCTATMPAQAAGASVAVPATAGGTGSVNAACSTSGVVTLSGSTCT